MCQLGKQKNKLPVLKRLEGDQKHKDLAIDGNAC